MAQLKSSTQTRIDVKLNTSAYRTQSTTAQAQSGTDTTTDMSPARVSEAMLAANSSLLTANGYTKLAGGLIIQWGKTGVSAIPSGGALTITFPIAFPNGVLGSPVVSSISRNGYNVSRGNGGAELAVSATSFVVQAELGATNGCSWIAIGY